MKKLLFLICVLATGTVFAGYQNTSNILVSKFDVYDDYGDGDIAIWATTSITQCPDGVYFKGSMPGKNSMFATVLTAMSQGISLKFYVMDTDIWAGGGSRKLCAVKAILWGQ